MSWNLSPTFGFKDTDSSKMCVFLDSCEDINIDLQENRRFLDKRRREHARVLWIHEFLLCVLVPSPGNQVYANDIYKKYAFDLSEAAMSATGRLYFDARPCGRVRFYTVLAIFLKEYNLNFYPEDKTHHMLLERT
jgi:hypothetical protein